MKKFGKGKVEMKGLIYRDIQINKRNIVLAVLVTALIFKTLMDSEISGYTEQVFLINIYTFVGVIVIYAIAEYVFKPTAVTNWQIFLYATPITKKIIVGEKYLFDYIFIGVGTVLSTLLIIVYIINSGAAMSFRNFFGIVSAVSLILTNSAIHKILVSLMGEKCATIFSVIFILCGFAILALISAFSYIQLGDNFDYVNISFASKPMCILFFFSICLHSISFFICVKIYNPYHIWK